MEISWGRALWRNFLGQSPDWYKLALIIFLIVNPLIFLISPFVAGWLLVAEFIFTLAMALKCYPLLPGGLLAIEAVFIGMTSAEHVREEVAANLEVLLLLMFMVAGIYFMKQLSAVHIYPFAVKHSLQNAAVALFLRGGGVSLSAFLDALTVVAVVISVAVGFYGIYHRVASSRTEDTDLQDDSHIDKHYKVVLEQFRGFLRSLMMHAGCRHRIRRRDDHGRRTTEPDHCQSCWLAFRRFLPAHVAGDRPGPDLRPVNLPAGGEAALVWLRRNAAGKSPRSAATV